MSVEQGEVMFDQRSLEDAMMMYSVLGSFHRQPPSDEVLAQFRGFLNQWPEAGELGQRGLAHLAQSEQAGEDAAAIRADHTSLYGVTAVALVAPYESVHRDHDRLLFDESTLQVREAYRELGFSAPRLNKEPDDHIGLEFNFMARALELALTAHDAGDAENAKWFLDRARTFHREHLAQWAAEMLEQVEALAGTHMMKGLALLSRGVLDRPL
ncbi:TorD/DmsD family molecular chaperone [Timonella senegalensis]|uniref:TorD/DmsD family molecular chaperone n=1 Tax=Timonella senegalensis TaxID=1465825 RepID=UPI001E5BC6D7|nr:molecular chaperone TorD family protein [Timonella senegalensis]